MNFKLLSLILVLFLLSPSLVLADSMDAGKEMISSALEEAPVKAADKMLAQNFGVTPGNLSDAENHTASEKLVNSIAAAEQHPETVKWVMDERKNDYITYILVGLILIVLVVGYFFLQKISPERAGEITEFFAGSQLFVGYGLYVKTLFLLIALPTILPFILDYSIEFEQALSSGIMQNSLEFISFSTENVPLYFYQAISYVLSGAFFLARVQFINVIYAKVLFLALALCIPWNFIRYLGLGAFLYFETALFMRPLVLWMNAEMVKHVASMSTATAIATAPATYGIMTIITVIVVVLATMWPFLYIICRLLRTKQVRYVTRFARRY